MTFPLTERQADQQVADAMRAANLDRANHPLVAVESKWDSRQADTLRGLYGVRDALASKPGYERMLIDLNAAAGRRKHPSRLMGFMLDEYLRNKANRYAMADEAGQQELYSQAHREWLAAGLGQS